MVKSPVSGLRSRVLFVGPAGCGKSEQLLKIFEERLAVENPLDPQSYFIVPSREHAERVIKRLIIRGSPGFFSSRVTTLDDLIEQSFEVPNPPAASNLTKIAIVRQLLNEDCGAYFEKIRGQPGFLNLVLNFLSELKDSCWTSQAFRLEMSRLKKLEPDAAIKYEALAGIYERYETALQQLGLRDKRDTLILYRSRSAPSARTLSFHTLCLDGFFDFTPVQMESVAELAKAAEYFSAALTWDAAHASVFEPVTATKKMFEALGFQIQNTGKDLPRFTHLDLAHISQNLFRVDAKVKKFENGIDWFEAPDTEAEAEMIARRILHWINEKSCRPSDIAVLLRSVRPYRAIFETVFRRFNIPFEIHERERLSDSEWIQTAARLVRIFRESWKKEDWMGFLRSSFVVKIAEQQKEDRLLHAFETRLRKKGVREGVENWNKAFSETGGKEADDEAMRGIFLFFTKTETEWRAAKTTAEWTRIFKHLLFREFGMLEFLKADGRSSSRLEFPAEIASLPAVARNDQQGEKGARNDGSLRGGKADEAIFHSQSSFLGAESAAPARFEKILEEMERAAERDAGEQAFEKFADDFLHLVELDLFSLPHLNQNTVQIYDVSLARQKEYEVVFVAGMAEKQFPLQVREDALLSDWERRLIQAKPYGLPERKARQQLEKYLFYLAVTRARRHVCLSHARRDEEGKPILPSFYLEEASGLFEGGLKPQIKKDTQPYPAFNEILTDSDLRRASVGALFNPWENPQPDETVLAALLRLALNDRGMRSDLRKALAGNEAKLADERILARDVFRPAAPSPTRLEAYGKCAYQYFSERVLKLQMTEEDTRARDQGKIMHGVLEDFFKGPWQKVVETELENLIDQSIEKWMSIETLDLGPYQTNLAYIEMKNILMRFIPFEIERLRKSAFLPRYFEWSVTADDNKPTEIEWGGIKLGLKGFVDRLDVDAENKHAIVSDYKRAKSFKAGTLEDGTALQLPLYLLAAKKVLGLEPAGGQLLNLKEGKAGGFYTEQAQVKKHLGQEEFDAVLTRAMRFSRRYLDELASGRIAVQPRDCRKGCGYVSVCRIEKWKLPEIAEKIRAEDKKLGF